MGATPNFVPKIWSAKILKELENNLVAKQITNMEYAGEIRGKGDTVFFNSLSDPTVSAYNGSISSYESMSDAQIAMVVDQANMFNWKINDVDKHQSNTDLESAQVTRSAYMLANEADKHVLGLYAQAGNTITDASCDSTSILSTIGEIGVKLDENNVPQQDRYLVIPPWVKLKLELAGIKFQINDGLKNGKGGLAFTDELGFRIYVSNNLTNSAATPVTECIACSGSAIAFAQQINKTEKLRLESDFATAVRGLHVFGAKVVKPKEMVRVTLTYTAETAI